MPRTKDKPALRIARFEVRGLDRETRDRWLTLAHATRRVLNDFRALWLAAHYAAGSHTAVREWRRADTEWVKTPKRDRTPAQRVRCPVECWKLDGEDLAERLRKQLQTLHPAMHSRCVTLAVQKERHTMGTVKGSNSAYPQWMLALSGDGEFRQNTGPQPVPFDRQNGKILPPDQAGGAWRLSLRLARGPATARRADPKLPLRAWPVDAPTDRRRNRHAVEGIA